MPTHHTIVQEHLSVINTRDVGSARNEATLQGAINLAGGTAFRTILLHEDESGGNWTLGGDITIPSNIMLFVPAGVTVGGTANLTLNGPLMAFRRNWWVGSGALIVPQVPLDVSGTRVQHLEFGNNIRNTHCLAVTLNAVAGSAPLVATGIIPQGARLESVIVTVLTSFGTGSGLTGLAIGDTCDGSAFLNNNRWADPVGLTAGTTTDGRHFTTTWGSIARTSAANLVVTPRGGNFTNVGSVRLDCTYTQFGQSSGAGTIPAYKVLKGAVSAVLNVPTAYGVETAMASVPLQVNAGDFLVVSAYAGLIAPSIAVTMRVREGSPTTGPLVLTASLGAATFDISIAQTQHANASVTGTRTYFLTMQTADNTTRTCNGAVLGILQYVPL